MKNSFGTRIIGIILLFLILAGAIYIGGGPSAITAFIDFPSLLIVVIIILSMLLFTGQLTDYSRAISIGMGKTEYTMKELKSSSIAINLSIKICYLSGIIGTFIGIIQILRHLDDPSSVGPAISVSFLTVFYSLFINVIQYAIKAKIDKEIVYREK